MESVGDPRVGLCADCVHSDVVESGRGSRFYRCRLSETDPRFARYPRLPVLACAGYEEAQAERREKPR
jgi:hypothetical protein